MSLEKAIRELRQEEEIQKLTPKQKGTLFGKMTEKAKGSRNLAVLFGIFGFVSLIHRLEIINETSRTLAFNLGVLIWPVLFAGICIFFIRKAAKYNKILNKI